MNNERFFNTYVELLTSNFHDALGKNIVFQAQAKINSEDQEELKRKIEILENKLQEFNDETKELGKLKVEFEQAKLQNSHLNTFKKELISARNTIEEQNKQIEKLKSKIEYLQMTPAQRKKFDAKTTTKIKSVVKDLEKETPISKPIIEETNSDSKDGGTF